MDKDLYKLEVQLNESVDLKHVRLSFEVYCKVLLLQVAELSRFLYLSYEHILKK